jgi:peptide/nickel transport system permease protein
MDFVVAARIAGVNMPTIIWRHVFPNTVNTLMVITSLQVGQVILLEASLSFLGLGLPVGEPAWGIMVAEGKSVILDVWWLSLLPGIAITVVVLAFNYFGDWMRDALDPKLRRL